MNADTVADLRERVVLIYMNEQMNFERRIGAEQRQHVPQIRDAAAGFSMKPVNQNAGLIRIFQYDIHDGKPMRRIDRPYAASNKSQKARPERRCPFLRYWPSKEHNA
ncbi:MAG: hypothetical protein RIB59_05700, partial [Rhodospirillales bacterium]